MFLRLYFGKEEIVQKESMRHKSAAIILEA